MEFHLNDIIMPRPGSMLFTIISFLILLFVLWKWAWKPILKALDQREQNIKNDLDTARDEREKAERLRKEYEDNLAGARKESNLIIQEARHAAEEVKESTIREAKEATRKLTEKAKQEMEAEKVRIAQELKSEVAELTTEAVKRVLQVGLTPEDHARIISAGMKELGKSGGNGKQ